MRLWHHRPSSASAFPALGAHAAARPLRILHASFFHFSRGGHRSRSPCSSDAPLLTGNSLFIRGDPHWDPSYNGLHFQGPRPRSRQVGFPPPFATHRGATFPRPRRHSYPTPCMVLGGNPQEHAGSCLLAGPCILRPSRGGDLISLGVSCPPQPYWDDRSSTRLGANSL